MKKLAPILIIILLIISISGIWWFSTHIFTGEPIPQNQVVRIIDGDTFKTASGEIIRLLCIDTPEKNKEGYEEAKNYLEELIINKEVILEADIQDKDKYSRSLRYVYLEELFINKEIYKAGHAKIMSIPPSNSLCEEITSSQ